VNSHYFGYPHCELISKRSDPCQTDCYAAGFNQVEGISRSSMNETRYPVQRGIFRQVGKVHLMQTGIGNENVCACIDCGHMYYDVNPVGDLSPISNDIIYVNENVLNSEVIYVNTDFLNYENLPYFGFAHRDQFCLSSGPLRID